MSKELLSLYSSKNPEKVHHRVRTRLADHDPSLSPKAQVGEQVHIGDVRRIGVGATIGSH